MSTFRPVFPLDPEPRAQVLWEYRSDPDPVAQREVRRRLRRKGWLWVVALMLVIGVMPVQAFGLWGLFYPGLILALGGLAVELAHWAYGINYPDQRVSDDGVALHFEGAVELFGQTHDPQLIDQIDQFSVYPALGGFHAHGGRARYNLLALWLTDGSQRAIAFKPRGYDWQKSPDPLGSWSRHQGLALASALLKRLPERWREPPTRKESVIGLPVDRRQWRNWMSTRTGSPRLRAWQVVLGLSVLFLLIMVLRLLPDAA